MNEGNEKEVEDIIVDIAEEEEEEEEEEVGQARSDGTEGIRFTFVKTESFPSFLSIKSWFTRFSRLSRDEVSVKK